jgi:ribosomal protein S3
MNIIRKIQIFKNNLKRKKDEKLINFAINIRDYYISKCCSTLEYNDKVKEVTKEIDLIGITQLKIKGNEYWITSQRPGILIGRRGTNIDSLSDYIRNHLNKKAKIKINEDKIIWHLYPQIAEYYDDMCDFE